MGAKITVISRTLKIQIMFVKLILKVKLILTTSHHPHYHPFNITIEHGLKFTILNMSMGAQKKHIVQTNIFSAHILQSLVPLNQ